MNKESDRPLSYRDAGVDIDAAAAAKKNIAKMVRSTFTKGVVTDIGGFGGLFALPDGIRKGILVASTDGVGTKLKIAFMAGRHNTVGQDLVNHCVNDILTTGARPLFFLDYIATGVLKPEAVAEIVEGLATACRENDCALIGGETAEMPDFYQPGEYDLAGTIIGLVEKDKILGPEKVKPGDLLVGLPSSGLHTNGYSLVRKIFFEVLNLGVDDKVEELGCTVAEELLRPHRSYWPLLQEAIEKGWINSMAHITGGGMTDNLPRSIPKDCDAVVKAGTWVVPLVFNFIQDAGRVDQEEMRRVFNMGIGMVLVVNPGEAEKLTAYLHECGEAFSIIGEVAGGKNGVRYV